jgi:hypothetical protein
MLRHVVIACILMGACARRDSIRATAPSPSRDAHKILAAEAGETWKMLTLRVDAQEVLTPEFLSVVCDWSRRLWRHESAAAGTDAQRVAAAQAWWRRAVWCYQLTHFRFVFEADTYLVQATLTEFAVREAELALDALGAEPQPADADEERVRQATEPPRPLAEIARDVLEFLEKPLEKQEPLTPDFIRLQFDASRRLCVVESAAATRERTRIAAARAHFDRLEVRRSMVEMVQTTLAGPMRWDDYRYFLAEAELWTLPSQSSLPTDRAAQLRRAMAGAAGAHVATLWRQKEAEGSLTPERVDSMCTWSARLRDAESAASPAIAADAHRRHADRMRALFADLKRRFDEGADVSMVQVTQAAYFLREAELSSAKTDR